MWRDWADGAAMGGNKAGLKRERERVTEGCLARNTGSRGRKEMRGPPPSKK